MSNQKQGWKSQSGFIWAVLGSVVGFANILSFSAQCYKNGGGAFLLPYFCGYLVLGIPLLFLEGMVGQKMGLPLVSAYGRVIGRPGKIFGWLAILGCLTIGSFYTVLTGYSLLYSYFAAAGKIPTDTVHFFKETVLGSTGSITEFGSLSWVAFLSTLLVGIFVWITLMRGIAKGIEKVCSFFMPLLTIFVIGFAVAASFLPGAYGGIVQFLTPEFSRLSDPALWRDVFGQLFFSLSLGLGIIIGYSQYNGDKVNLRRSMLWVALGDFAISFIAGWVVFACIGYMSQLTGTPFASIVQSDSAFEIGFMIFPKILQTFSPLLQPFFGFIFFFSVFIAGITGVFSIVESIAGNLEKEAASSRKVAVSFSMGIICVLSIFFCMGNGQYLIGALAPMVLGLNMILSALLEIFIFLYLSKEIKSDAFWYGGKAKKQFSYLSLKFFVPLVLLVIFISSAMGELSSSFGLPEILRWSWLGGALVLSAAFAYKTPVFGERKIPAKA